MVEAASDTPPQANPSGRRRPFISVVLVWFVLTLAATVATVWTALVASPSAPLFLEILRLTVSLPVVALVLLVARSLTFYRQLAQFLEHAAEVPTPWGPLRANAPPAPIQTSKEAPGIPTTATDQPPAEAAEENAAAAAARDAPSTELAPIAAEPLASQPELVPKTAAEADVEKVRAVLLTQQRLRVYWYYRYLVVALPARAIDILRWLNQSSYPTTPAPAPAANVPFPNFHTAWIKAIPSPADRATLLNALQQNGLIAFIEGTTISVMYAGTRLLAFVDATWNPITDYPGDQPIVKCECCGADVTNYLARLVPHNKPATPEAPETLCECSNRITTA